MQSLQCAVALSRGGGLPAPSLAAAFPSSPAEAEPSCFLTSTGGTFGFDEGIFLPSVVSSEITDSALPLPRCLLISMAVVVFATRACLAATVSAALADRAL